MGSAREYDVIVIGGGHAGAEAAWAAARMGACVALVTLDPSRIGQMSCNPAIGGQAKGQMVRELDALGGLMALATDRAGIQFRILNASKGPAVHGPRAQCDKYRYAQAVQDLLATDPRIEVVRGEVADLISIDTDRAPNHAFQPESAPESVSSGHAIAGITLADGQILRARAVVVTTGTFMRGLMHTGETKTEGGRVGEAAAKTLSGNLKRLGFELGRLKTGTPPRLRRDSIDWSRFEHQPGDDPPTPFSFLHEYGQETDSRWSPPLPQLGCHIGHTTPEAHEIIRANLHRAPMFSGQIEGVGPRYCPSIEDKVTRFAEKEQHQLFLEPESLDTDEIYVNGISTSLPADVQRAVLDHIPGLEKSEVIRWGYAVEYDMVWPTQVKSTLETKLVSGLFLAGQINGTSGYEEAAGQGFVAGVNAARMAATGVADFVLSRSEAYIGVLVDDLVTKPPTEPYRMFTSRAEHRLHLRSDNADERLTPLGRQVGTVDDSRWRRFEHRRGQVDLALAALKSTRLDGQTAYDLLRRHDTSFADLAERHDALRVDPAVARLVEIRVKYQGYLERQDAQIKRMDKLETKLIPSTLDFATVRGLRAETVDKLRRFTPRSLGQALRISGITPADVTLLAVHLERDLRSGK